MNKTPLRNAIGEVRGLWPHTLLVLASAFLLELCQLVTPLMLRLVIDKVAFHADSRLVVELFVLFAVLAIMQAIFIAGRSRALISFSELLNTSWLSSLFDRAMRLPISYFELQGVTSVAGKFWSVSYMQRVLTAAFLEGVLDGAMAALSLALIFYLAPTVGLIVAGAVTVYVIFRFFTYQKQYHADVDRADLALTQQSYLWETIASIQTVRLNAYEERRKSLWFHELAKLFRADFSFQVCESRSRAALVGIGSLSRVTVIAVMAVGVVEGSMTAGALVAVAAYCEMCTSRGFALVDRLVAFKLLDVHRAKMDELIVAPVDPLGDGGEDLVLTRDGASIELINATIDVGEKYNLLKNTSLRVEAGECIGIVGASGAGKSTLVRAMLGLVSLSEGKLLIAGQDIRCIRRREYLQTTATVLGQDRIFRATVYENVRMACESASDAWVIECVRSVGLHETIMRLSEGYSTVVKDEDVRLSAGQRQRLLIARALCRKPRFLFLDEATSNLDAASEQLVIEKLRSMSVTMVLVSHRPSPLSLADRVYELSGGGLVLRERSLEPAYELGR